MPSNMKKYILTSITLGVIAASGALLIAGTNMLTRDTIAKNEQKSINSGIAKIFGTSETITNESSLKEGVKYDYVITCYQVNDSNNSLLGYAFRTTGSNNYGKISLIVGFNKDSIYKGLSVVTNEQSFASTLKKNYIDLIKDGNQTINDVDVSCGATYGAKTVRAMVTEAEKALKDKLGA